jgi:hypothetical protein
MTPKSKPAARCRVGRANPTAFVRRSAKLKLHCSGCGVTQDGPAQRGRRASRTDGNPTSSVNTAQDTRGRGEVRLGLAIRLEMQSERCLRAKVQLDYGAEPYVALASSRRCCPRHSATADPSASLSSKLGAGGMTGKRNNPPCRRRRVGHPERQKSRRDAGATRTSHAIRAA